MSNIGSRTSSTLVLLLRLQLVLGYYYASNIVLEEFVMQVCFGLTIVILMYLFLSVFLLTILLLGRNPVLFYRKD